MHILFMPLVGEMVPKKGVSGLFWEFELWEIMKIHLYIFEIFYFMLRIH